MVPWNSGFETGRKAEAVDAWQAEAIEEALIWLRITSPARDRRAG